MRPPPPNRQIPSRADPLKLDADDEYEFIAYRACVDPASLEEIRQACLEEGISDCPAGDYAGPETRSGYSGSVAAIASTATSTLNLREDVGRTRRPFMNEYVSTISNDRNRRSRHTTTDFSGKLIVTATIMTWLSPLKSGHTPAARRASSG